MDEHEMTQLSSDVGGERPNFASMKISGGLALTRELRKGETVGIRVIDADGQILVEGDGHVAAVESTERAHTAKVQY